jgi:hypothetical protein
LKAATVATDQKYGFVTFQPGTLYVAHALDARTGSDEGDPNPSELNGESWIHAEFYVYEGEAPYPRDFVD